MKKAGFILFTIVFFCFGCSDKDSPSGSDSEEQTFGDGTLYNTINWVGTDLVFDTTVEKNDFSLLYFSADDCIWCHMLETVTLKDSTVIQILGESFNICELSTTADTNVVFSDSVLTVNEVKKIYAFSGTPVIIVLDRYGSYLTKISGYREPDNFVQVLHNIRLNY